MELCFVPGVFDNCSHSLNEKGWSVGIRTVEPDGNKDARFYFTLRTDRAVKSTTVYSHQRYRTNDWTHLMATYNGHNITLYVDGAKVCNIHKCWKCQILWQDFNDNHNTLLEYILLNVWVLSLLTYIAFLKLQNNKLEKSDSITHHAIKMTVLSQSLLDWNGNCVKKEKMQMNFETSSHPLHFSKVVCGHAVAALQHFVLGAGMGAEDIARVANKNIQIETNYKWNNQKHIYVKRKHMKYIIWRALKD